MDEPSQRFSLSLSFSLFRTIAAAAVAAAAAQGDLAAPHLPVLAASLATQAGPALHLRGLRYLYLDRMSLAARGSPARKTAALSREAVALLAGARADLAQRAAMAAGGAGPPPEAEAAVRGLGDTWVVARRAEGRELFAVLDRKGDTLLDTAAAVAAVAEEHFPGAFVEM